LLPHLLDGSVGTQARDKFIRRRAQAEVLIAERVFENIQRSPRKFWRRTLTTGRRQIF
jgi:hypothetical protein